MDRVTGHGPLALGLWALSGDSLCSFRSFVTCVYAGQHSAGGLCLLSTRPGFESLQARYLRKRGFIAAHAPATPASSPRLPSSLREWARRRGDCQAEDRRARSAIPRSMSFC